jgi:glucose-1-phosphate cytidylyltransferase
MEAVILCGGLGTRLREETEYRPKPMIEVGGRPILWHIMKWYGKFGVEDFVLCLGYKGSMIKDYFLSYRARVSDFTIHLDGGHPIEFRQAEPPAEKWRVTCADTGLNTQTGARLRKALRYVCSDTFFMTYGDGLADVDLDALLAYHRAHGKVATLSAVIPGGRFGELSLEPSGSVRSFSEKPDAGRAYINGGFFVFDTGRIAPYLDGDDELALERAPLETLAADGELMAFRHDGYWQCMDTYREWKILEDLWNAGRAPWAVS